MYNSTGREVSQSTIGRNLESGVRIARINSVELAEASTGKLQLRFYMEGEDLGTGFDGWDIDRENPEAGKYKGQTARIGASYYVDSSKYQDFVDKFIVIADALDVRPELDAIKASTIQEYVEKAAKVVEGKFAYWFFAGEEKYVNGRLREYLSLPKKKFVFGLDTPEGELPVFDPNNSWHLKKAVKPESMDEFGSSDDVIQTSKGSEFDLG